MRAVDTNVIVRIVVRDDPQQAVEGDRFIASGAWVSLLALAEAVWTLGSVYDRSAEEIAAGVEMLLNHQHLTLQDADVVLSALTRYRQRPAVGFTDCLLLEVARKAGHLPVGTFDRQLSKLAGAELLGAAASGRH
jgi:predicted nucleic-acid-binding protein